MLAQLEGGATLTGVAPTARVVLTHLAPTGQPTGTISWPVNSGTSRATFSAVRETFDPSSNSYRVAWMLTGDEPATFASRSVTASGALSPVQKIADPGVLPHPDFDISANPRGLGSLAIWLADVRGRATDAVLAQRLTRTGAPVGPTLTVGQNANRLPNTYEEPGLLATNSTFLVGWYAGTNLNSGRIAVTGNAVQSLPVIKLPPNPTRALVVYPNSAAGTLLILAPGGNPSADQVYAQAIKLPSP
jgi:hypothetical protein